MNRAMTYLKNYGLYVILFFYGLFYHITSSEFWPVTISKTWLHPESFEYSMLQKPLFTLFLSVFHLFGLPSHIHLWAVKFVFALLGVIGLFLFKKLVDQLTNDQQSPNKKLLFFMLLCFPVLLNNFFNIRTDQLAFLAFSLFLFSYLKSNTLWMYLSFALIALTGIKELIFSLPAAVILVIHFKKNYQFNFKYKVFTGLTLIGLIIWGLALNTPAFSYMWLYSEANKYPSTQLLNFIKNEALLLLLLLGVLVYNFKKRKHLLISGLSLYFLIVIASFPQMFDFFLASLIPFVYLPLIVFFITSDLSKVKRYAAVSIVLVSKFFIYQSQLAYWANFRQIAYVKRMQNLVTSNNYLYLDGMGIFPKSNFSKCFVSPNDDIANSGCLERIKNAEPDIVIVTSRLILFGDELFKLLNNNYTQIYACYWVKNKHMTDDMIKNIDLNTGEIPLNLF